VRKAYPVHAKRLPVHLVAREADSAVGPPVLAIIARQGSLGVPAVMTATRAYARESTGGRRWGKDADFSIVVVHGDLDHMVGNRPTV
jgi:hypothetical protein